MKVQEGQEIQCFQGFQAILVAQWKWVIYRRVSPIIVLFCVRKCVIGVFDTSSKIFSEFDTDYGVSDANGYLIEYFKQ